MIEEYGRTECSCEECQDMCRQRVCWPTPEEARKLMEKFGTRLGLDYWEDDSPIFIVCPAIMGHEGEKFGWWPAGQCTFLRNGLCEVHTIKPSEGAISIHDKKFPELHAKIARLWDSDVGRAVVEEFRSKYLRGE